MADVRQSSLYGNYRMKDMIGGLNLQWHITVECDQRCKHCYMFGSKTYPSEKTNPLNLETCFQLIDEYADILQRFGIAGSIAITGGDPILRPDFWEILNYINQKQNIELSILGNPYHITNEVAQRLYKTGVRSYQISLDGMEETHDSFRKKGSFQASLQALQILNRNGIGTHVMFTLSKSNARELLEVYKFVSHLGYVDIFAFDRLVPQGQGKDLVETGNMTAEEHRELLLEMLQREIRENTTLFQSRKDQMWRPLLYEAGLLKPLPKEDTGFLGGCGINCHVLSILADGTMYACRRLPQELGKYPEQRLWDCIVNAPLLKEYQNLDHYLKCRDCELGFYCRGCPAVKYGFHGDPFQPDPHCWLNIQSGDAR